MSGSPENGHGGRSAVEVVSVGAQRNERRVRRARTGRGKPSSRSSSGSMPSRMKCDMLLYLAGIIRLIQRWVGYV
jgi:hypothetical protein